MKKIFTSITAIFGLLTATMAQVPNYVPTSGLLAWYSFTGNSNDVSGNGYNGTNNGATLTTDRFGSTNSAYSFNGSSNNIDVSDVKPLRLNNTDYTISFWTYINAYGTGGGTAFIYKRSSGSQNGWAIGADQGTQNKLHLITSGGADPRGYTTSPLVINGWHNVTVVYTLTSQELKFYIDGVLDNTTTGVDNNYNPVGGMPSPNANCTSVMRFGQDTKNNSYWLDGKLDDIGLWSHALTQGEVTTIFTGNCVTSNITTGLVASYPFSGNANDISGSNYNGTNNGATLTTDRFGNANSAYSFNGTSNYIDVNDVSPLRLNNTDYTISFWTELNAYSTGGGTAFIYKRSNGSQNGWGLGADQGTQNKLMLLTSENTDPRGYSTSTLALSGWHNITAVYTQTSQELKFYIDGVLDNTTTGVDNNYNPVGGMPTPSASCTSVMRFGQDTKNNSYWLDGKLDDIKIYNRALTDCDVDSLFNEPNPLSTGVTELNSGSIKIYPNPASSRIYIDNTNSIQTDINSIRVTNSIGQVVFIHKTSEKILSIDLSSLKSGIYFLQFTGKQGNIIDTRKIIKQ